MLDNNRPSWDEQHMMSAILPALRTSCLVRGVGAALVVENRVIASAYNGAPPGLKTCLEIGHCVYQNYAHEHVNKHGGDFEKIKESYKPLCIASHAEANVMSQCARMGISPTGGTLYVSTFPCFRCSRDEIVGKGIISVKFLKDYLSDDTMISDDRRSAQDMFDQTGIKTEQIELSPERIMELATRLTLVGDRTDYSLLK